MQKFVHGAVVAATLALAPTAALAEGMCTTTIGIQPNKYVMINDDPNIPNCVVSPQKPYPGGVCERVQEFVNFGNTNVQTTCNYYRFDNIS